MRISLKKKFGVFYILLIIIMYIFSDPIRFGICDNRYTFGEHIGCLDRWHEHVLIISLILFLSSLPFSVITYRMKDQVFVSWFKFARWYVPLLVIAYFVFPTSISGGLGIGSGITEGFNTLVLILLFSIFAITSIVKIVRAYKQSK